MPLIRCSHCQMPLTDAEARTGTCPSCGGALTGPGTSGKKPWTLAWLFGPLYGLTAVVFWLNFGGLAYYILIYEPPQPKKGSNWGAYFAMVGASACFLGSLFFGVGLFLALKKQIRPLLLLVSMFVIPALLAGILGLLIAALS